MALRETGDDDVQRGLFEQRRCVLMIKIDLFK